MTQRHTGRVEVQLHPFLTLALEEVSQQLNPSGCFTPREQPWYLLNRRLDGPQSQSGHFREDRNLLPLPGIEPRIT